MGLIEATLGGVGLGMNAWNLWQQQQNYNSNFDWQKDMFAYNAGIQNTIFNREDTAIQRRVADLEAAGLSPVLAAGQGANAGSVVHSETPQNERVDASNMLQTVMSLLKMKEDISNTVAQRDLIEAQVINAKSNTFKNLYDLEKTSADIANKNIDTAIKSHDYNIFKKTGTTSQGGTLTRELRNAQGMFENFTSGSSKGVVNELFRKAIEFSKKFIRKS